MTVLFNIVSVARATKMKPSINIKLLLSEKESKTVLFVELYILRKNQL